MLAASGDGPHPETGLWAGRYELGERLGAGGLATVHRGRRVGPAGFARPVAIKRLHAHWSRHADAVMFLDEARIASCIVHPNVVATLDVVSEGGEYAVVMELVEGATFEQLVARGAPPLAVTMRIVADVLRGLHAAHEARDSNGEPLGVVHRDVAPSNILVGRDGIARIGDFGVAKARGRLAATRNGEVKGHLSYMAPEQLVGDEVDARADIFGAGVVLWEALTGRRLFHGENEAQVVYALLERPIASPRTIVLDLPIAIESIALRALAREVDERFASARAMAEALESAGAIATREQVAAWVSENVTARENAGMTAGETAEAPAADTWLDAPPARSVKERRKVRLAATCAILVLMIVSMTGILYRIRGSHAASIDIESKGPAASPARDLPVVDPVADLAPPVVPPIVSAVATSAAPSATSPLRHHGPRPQGAHPAPRRGTPVRLYARD